VKNPNALILAGLLLAGSALADSSPASDESVRQLLELTEAHKLIDAAKSQVNAMVTAALQDAVQGKTLTPAREAVVENMHVKMIAMVDEMLNWDTLLPMYMRIYRESFTQDELDGMTAFYKTPAGQAVVKKMPAVMQRVLGEMQVMLKPMQEKIRQIQQQTVRELQATPGAS
jgi:uncharacterized protein